MTLLVHKLMRQPTFFWTYCSAIVITKKKKKEVGLLSHKYIESNKTNNTN